MSNLSKQLFHVTELNGGSSYIYLYINICSVAFTGFVATKAGIQIDIFQAVIESFYLQHITTPTL